METSLPSPVTDQNPPTPQAHRNHHTILHNFFNGIMRGPFHIAHNTSGIDTGIELWTPEIGERILGLAIEIDEFFDTPDEQIGLGITGTSDADLALKSVVWSTVQMPSYPTFSRVPLLGTGFGGAGFRCLTSAPLKVRTLIGGNTQGSLNLFVFTLPL